jgi:hypothetical protein
VFCTAAVLQTLTADATLAATGGAGLKERAAARNRLALATSLVLLLASRRRGGSLARATAARLRLDLEPAGRGRRMASETHRLMRSASR